MIECLEPPLAEIVPRSRDTYVKGVIIRMDTDDDGDGDDDDLSAVTVKTTCARGAPFPYCLPFYCASVSVILPPPTLLSDTQETAFFFFFLVLTDRLFFFGFHTCKLLLLAVRNFPEGTKGPFEFGSVCTKGIFHHDYKINNFVNEFWRA